MWTPAHTWWRWSSHSLEEGMRLKASQDLVQMILEPKHNWGHCILEWVYISYSDSYKGKIHTLGGFLYNIHPQSQLPLSAPLHKMFAETQCFSKNLYHLYSHTVPLSSYHSGGNVKQKLGSRSSTLHGLRFSWHSGHHRTYLCHSLPFSRSPDTSFRGMV